MKENENSSIHGNVNVNTLVDYLLNCSRVYLNNSKTIEYVSMHKRKMFRQLSEFLKNLAVQIQEDMFSGEEISSEIPPIGSEFGFKNHKLKPQKKIIEGGIIVYKTFDRILPDLKRGKLFKRSKGWGGDELFIKIVNDLTVDGERVTDSMVIKTESEGYSPFAPSVCDILAFDWVEVDENGEIINE